MAWGAIAGDIVDAIALTHRIAVGEGRLGAFPLAQLPAAGRREQSLCALAAGEPARSARSTTYAPPVRKAATAIALCLVAAPATVQAHYPNPGATYCGFVSYKGATDWGAESWARGTSCKQARRLAWDFRDRRYGVIGGYQCTTRNRAGDRASGMHHADSRCVKRGSRGRVVVTLAHT